MIQNLAELSPTYLKFYILKKYAGFHVYYIHIFNFPRHSLSSFFWHLRYFHQKKNILPSKRCFSCQSVASRCGVLVVFWEKAFQGTHKGGWNLVVIPICDAKLKEFPNVPFLSVSPCKTRASSRVKVQRSRSILKHSPSPASGQCSLCSGLQSITLLLYSGSYLEPAWEVCMARGHIAAKATWLWKHVNARGECRS